MSGATQPALPASLAAAFERRGRRRRLQRGARLFTAGEPAGGLHLVESGHLRILRGRGRSVVVHHEGPGGLLGETALFAGIRYPATAVATEPTTCRYLARAEVLQLTAADGAIANYFLFRLASRLAGVIDRLDRLGLESVATRLARHLLARGRASEREVITLGMTQAELAEELGTVREVLVRELRGLTSRGMLRPVGRGKYAITAVAELEAVADGAS